jgi:DNA-binding NarL/FixJ family response regulator
MSLLDPALETAWIDEVRRACADRPSIVARFRSLVATERELETVTAPVNSPTLSPREREVLIELARGSTYADIAANLFVSENTVKTHISSLYSKLSAGRRSEALAVARTMHLI